jgi:hypothetical protein
LCSTLVRRAAGQVPALLPGSKDTLMTLSAKTKGRTTMHYGSSCLLRG